jgi:hypothetical protein
MEWYSTRDHEMQTQILCLRLRMTYLSGRLTYFTADPSTSFGAKATPNSAQDDSALMIRKPKSLRKPSLKGLKSDFTGCGSGTA